MISKNSSFQSLVFNFCPSRVLQVKNIFCSYFHIFLYLKNLAPPGLNPESAPGSKKNWRSYLNNKMLQIALYSKSLLYRINLNQKIFFPNFQNKTLKIGKLNGLQKFWKTLNSPKRKTSYFSSINTGFAIVVNCLLHFYEK